MVGQVRGVSWQSQRCWVAQVRGVVGQSQRCGVGQVRGVVSQVRCEVGQFRGLVGQVRGVVSQVRGVVSQVRGVGLAKSDVWSAKSEVLLVKSKVLCRPSQRYPRRRRVCMGWEIWTWTLIYSTSNFPRILYRSTVYILYILYKTLFTDLSVRLPPLSPSYPILESVDNMILISNLANALGN